MAGSEMEIKVEYLARVEGEGGIYLKIKDGKVEYVEVSIFEPPRFFEVVLRGRKYLDAPDITARICGICPIAYVMSASRAMEKALGIEVPEEIKKLRRITYLAEWIESHVLHVALLHAPDFLGYESAIHMVNEHGDFVKDALSLKGWGNLVLKTLGGRSVHPVSYRVGGFHRIIRREELFPLLRRIEEVKRKARNLLEFVMDLTIPDIKYDMVYASLKNDKEYPILEGRVATNVGIEFSEDEFEKYVRTEQMKYSTSLRYKLADGNRPYIVGPLARFNLNYDLLMPEVRDLLESRGYRAPLRNTYESIIARAAETYHAVLELEELLATYKEPKVPYVEPKEIKASKGAAITEAPRGMLYHYYEIDDEGYIKYANIVAPTCQNYAAMEEDIRKVAPLLIQQPPDKAQWLAEQTIRNYDPCISCSVHAIKLHIIKE